MLRELTYVGVYPSFTLGMSKTVWVKSRIQILVSLLIPKL